MTTQIALALSILAAASALLVFGSVPVEVTALLVLGGVALTGLVTPIEALAGFSNPAVVTVWAVFILSGGLTRTGVANHLGRYVLRVAGQRETVMTVVIMTSAGAMSAFMNNVAVAALMLPVVMDIARRTDHHPSRLLLPLAYGSLLGGLTTLIGTPPNILVSNALRDNGLQPFALFDYTPVGIVVMVAGIAFMALVGRHLLPRRNVAEESPVDNHMDLQEQYALSERMHLLRVPAGSPLIGKTLAEAKIGTLLGLHVIGILRDGHTHLAPEPAAALWEKDGLLVTGRLDRMEKMAGWRRMSPDREADPVDILLSNGHAVAESCLSKGSLFAGKTPDETGLAERFGVEILTVRRGEQKPVGGVSLAPLEPGDCLLLHGVVEKLAEARDSADLKEFRILSPAELTETWRLQENLLVLRPPEITVLSGRPLREWTLAAGETIRPLLVIRRDGTTEAAGPKTPLHPADRLLALVRPLDFPVLQGLLGLEVEKQLVPDRGLLESARVGLIEAVLSPRTTLAGKTLSQLHFREKYGLSVLAVWHRGRAYRSELQDMPIRFGDALLLFGPRAQLAVLGREPDFLVLTQAAQEAPRQEKARAALLIMTAVLLPVILGIVPIYIAAVVGAACMVLFGCLNMAEAYRFIEWKAVFLIAGMLPLGTALEKSGAARFIADGVVEAAGPYGPQAVLLGLVTLTFLATCFIPTAALVVLLAPIVLSSAAELGMSPYALMMAIALAASSSFMTPISHPANVLVMGPGGYRFIDYLKVGIPLTAVVTVVILFVMPLIWPLVQVP